MSLNASVAGFSNPNLHGQPDRIVRPDMSAQLPAPRQRSPQASIRIDSRAFQSTDVDGGSIEITCWRFQLVSHGKSMVPTDDASATTK